MIVGRRRRRLYQEDLLAPHRLTDLHGNFDIRISFDDAVAELTPELARKQMGQRRIGCPAKYREAVDHSGLDQFGC